MDVRGHPPAWYPDPRNDGRVRRWDGRAWTLDVRPVPAWVRTVRLSPGPRGRVPGAGRGLWAASAGLLALSALVVLMVADVERAAPDRLSDRTFAMAANRRCARTEVEVFRPDHAPLLGAAEAQRVERVTTGWEAMVQDLRALPLAGADPDDAVRVERWLTTWDRWTALGHDYATAVDEGDTTAASAAIRRGQLPRAELAAFAEANDMPACVFRP